jgi:peptidyl-prolyl cis-trans isomerase SurA
MKFTNNLFGLLLCAVFLAGFSATAQEIIKEKTQDSTKTKTIGQKKKIDGVIASVGDYIILDSDIDKTFLELSSQGNSIKDITRCQMLGKLLEDKLYAHQAVQDSIVVKDEEVKEKMNEQLNYMVEQIGSMDKVVKYFKKNSEEEFRTELFDIIKMNKLAGEMQKKIVDEVEITPEETRTFFKSIPQSELPTFGAEMKCRKLLLHPKFQKKKNNVWLTG